MIVNYDMVVISICRSEELIFDVIFSTGTEYQPFTILANVTDTDPRSNLGFYFVARGDSNDRVIKLTKGDDGDGTCYGGPFYQQCESHFSLSYVKHRNLQYRALRFTIKTVTKSMAGKYQLKPYYNWANGNYSDNPLLEFTLYIQGKTDCFVFL